MRAVVYFKPYMFSAILQFRKSFYNVSLKSLWQLCVGKCSISILPSVAFHYLAPDDANRMCSSSSSPIFQLNIINVSTCDGLICGFKIINKQFFGVRIIQLSLGKSFIYSKLLRSKKLCERSMRYISLGFKLESGHGTLVQCVQFAFRFLALKFKVLFGLINCLFDARSGFTNDAFLCVG